MRKISEELLVLLALFLPWHGAITVFFPDNWRFWKELLLVVFFFLVLLLELRRRYKEKDSFSLLWTDVLAFLFLVWLGALVVVDGDKNTALMAARYIGTGFIVFLLTSRFLSHLDQARKVVLFSRISVALLSSSICAVFFGIWMKYFGGIEVLQNFYSPTISSWVPGQTVPLYHMAGGFIRMQGGSSGPTEFASILLAGLLILPFLPLIRKWKRVIAFLLLIGIFQSFSRMALLLALGVILFYFCSQYRKHLKKVVLSLGIVVLMGLGVLFGNKTVYQNFFERAGSSEHITRPIQAIRAGLYRPFTGNLGELGPSARIKNLREYNDDTAMIAENVFADYFAQMGMLGLGLAILFFVFLFRETSSQAWPFLVAVLVSANTATLFDMTPVSILFFLLFAFFVSLRKIRLETTF